MLQIQLAPSRRRILASQIIEQNNTIPYTLELFYSRDFHGGANDGISKNGVVIFLAKVLRVFKGLEANNKKASPNISK